MENKIFKIWKDAKVEERVEFIKEIIKRYNVLLCAAIKDLKYCKDKGEKDA